MIHLSTEEIPSARPEISYVSEERPSVSHVGEEY